MLYTSEMAIMSVDGEISRTGGEKGEGLDGGGEIMIFDKLRESSFRSYQIYEDKRNKIDVI